MPSGGIQPIRGETVLGQPRPNPHPLGISLSIFLLSLLNLSLPQSLSLPWLFPSSSYSNAVWLLVLNSINSDLFYACSLQQRGTDWEGSIRVEPIRLGRRNFFSITISIERSLWKGVSLWNADSMASVDLELLDPRNIIENCTESLKSSCRMWHVGLWV